MKTNEAGVVAIKGLEKFLVSLKSDIEDLSRRLREGGKIPEFFIPEWPENLPMIDIEIFRVNILRPRIITDTKPIKKYINLSSEKAGLKFTIKEKGFIDVVVYRIIREGLFWRKRGWSKYNIESFNSNSTDENDRKCCFIIFHQLLDEICEDITRQLKERVIRLKRGVADYEKTMRSVEECFKPLIPFIVAQELDDD